MATLADLEYELRRIDGRGYRAYKDIAGAYHTSTLSLFIDKSQTRAIGLALYLAREQFMRKGMTIAEILEALDRRFETAGLDGLAPFVRQGHHPGNLARPRRFEIAAALNRLRSLGIRG